MRPDCSLRIRPGTALPDVELGSIDVWLHFDAKYRIERLREQFDAGAEEAESAAAEAETTERLSQSKREDLLKMHAYRDAIRRSAGAYVLFPGDVSAAPFREFTEPLPGLGAFALRPTEGSRARGRETLEAFLREALDHVADRASQDERYRYWRAVVRGREEPSTAGQRSLPHLSTPPRDAPVLCGRLREVELEWTSRMQIYALPADHGPGALSADASELRAEWALLGRSGRMPTLWAREGAWYVQSREDLAESGYSEPSAHAYLCAAFNPVRDAPAWLEEVDLDSLQRGGKPTGARVFATTWADLLEAATRES